VIHAHELFSGRLMKRDLPELRLRRNPSQGRRDSRRPRPALRGADRVHDLTVTQKEEQKLVRQPDRDIARDARSTVALGIADEVANMHICELRPLKENAPVRIPQLRGVCSHRGGKKGNA